MEYTYTFKWIKKKKKYTKKKKKKKRSAFLFTPCAKKKGFFSRNTSWAGAVSDMFLSHLGYSDCRKPLLYHTGSSRDAFRMGDQLWHGKKKCWLPETDAKDPPDLSRHRLGVSKTGGNLPDHRHQRKWRNPAGNTRERRYQQLLGSHRTVGWHRRQHHNPRRHANGKTGRSL